MLINSSNKLIKDLMNLFSYFYLLNLLLTAVFMRSYVGLILFNFRIGEILIGFCLLISIIIFSNTITQKLNINNEKTLIKITRIIVLSFFIVLIANNNFQISLSIIKTSSYIWSLSYIFFGYFFLSKIEVKFTTLLFGLALFASYFITFVNYPNFIIDFFIQFSDKFQFIKAADTLLILVIFNFLIKKCNLNRNYEFFIFVITTSLFIPYFFVQSRGSVLASLVFVLISLYSYKKYISENILKFSFAIILSFVAFYFSSYLLSGIDFSEQKNEIEVTALNDAIKKEVVKKKNISQGFLTFYFADGRIHSYDNTTDWRLDIWQDLVEDLVIKNKILFGFGYEGVFEIMLDPSAPGRLGRDGLNENVHNYFVNILGRGGLFQLSLFLYFYFLLFKRWSKNIGRLDFFNFFIPILIVSSLDVTMEGVQFPLLLLSFVGYFLSLDYHNKV